MLRKSELGENESELIVAVRSPRLNSNSCSPCGSEKTLITVPLSDAVAIFESFKSMAIAARGLSCAKIVVIGFYY